MTGESEVAARTERVECVDVWQPGFYIKQELFQDVFLLQIIVRIREVEKFPSPFPGALEISREKLHISEVGFLMLKAYILTNCQ